MKFLSLAIVSALSLWGQAPASQPQFEVVSIRPSTDLLASGQFKFGLHIDGAQVRCTYLSLKDYIIMAYHLKSYQFTGPDWMASERFDISAKLPEGATRDQVPAMLQSMLEERFQLKTHRASKEFPVYALTAKTGLKMKESPLADDADPNATRADKNATNVDVNAGRGNTVVNLGRGASLTFGDDKLTATKLTMAILADQLGRFLDRPVIDATDLKGTYDFALQFTPEEFMAINIRSAISAGVQLPPQALKMLENSSDGPVLTAVQALGLKLESRKAPLEILIADSALKSPSGN